MKYLEFKDLKGKTAVVTGAGGSIGQATVRALIDQGVTVIATDRDEAVLRMAYQDMNDGIHFIRHDVTIQEDSESVAETVVERYGKLDIWINNAGTLVFEPALEIKAADWKKQMDVNLNGVLYGCQAAARHMKNKTHGAIINLSSFAGTKARRGSIHYSTSKAAVAHLTQCLALEWGELGIRVNAIAPGYIETPMTSFIHTDPNVLQDFLSRTPLNRLGTKEEIALHILYMASDVSSFMTGNILIVDGGVRLT